MGLGSLFSHRRQRDVTQPDLTDIWAKRKRAQGFRVIPGAQGPVVVNESGEAAYCYLYDSRDDSRMRVPNEWREYYLHKTLRVQEVREGKPVMVGMVKKGVYHEHHAGTPCTVALNTAKPPVADHPVGVVAPQSRVKPRRRHRGTRGSK